MACTTPGSEAQNRRSCASLLWARQNSLADTLGSGSKTNGFDLERILKYRKWTSPSASLSRSRPYVDAESPKIWVTWVISWVIWMVHPKMSDMSDLVSEMNGLPKCEWSRVRVYVKKMHVSSKWQETLGSSNPKHLTPKLKEMSFANDEVLSYWRPNAHK